MERAEWAFQVRDGELPDKVETEFFGMLKQLDGRIAELRLSERKRKRSGQQNRLYWGFVVRPMTRAMREWGNEVDDEDVHTLLKMEHGMTQVAVTPQGKPVRFLRSTTKMNKEEFTAYIQWCIMFAATRLDLQIVLPDEDV